jgi:site-specific DNA-methyltransferase (adenine-specific)
MSRRLPRNTVLVGDVRTRLAELPDASIDTAITSPPYVALRNYGMAEQIGGAADTDAWLADMRQVGRELARVLKP